MLITNMKRTININREQVTLINAGVQGETASVLINASSPTDAGSLINPRDFRPMLEVLQ